MQASTELLLYACWIPKGAWEVRVDSPHQATGHKHIHIRRKRNGKGEYSWNLDGTRHDKHRFPVSEGMIGKAKQIAADELKIPISSLEFLTSVPKAERISILQQNDFGDVYTHVYVDADGLLLISDNWVILVARPD